MASHLVGQYPITTFTTPVNGTSPINADQVRGNDNTIKSAYNNHDDDATIHFQDSLASARPTASTAGQKWLDNDTYRIYYDDGSAWHEVAYAATGGGAFTAPVTITSTTSPQLTILYDGSNTLTIGVSSAGVATFNATGASQGFVFSDPVTHSGTLTQTGVATFTAQPILSSLTASLPVFTDASKGLVSNAMTGTGSVVMSASPTLTGTVTAATVSLTGNITITKTSPQITYVDATKTWKTVVASGVFKISEEGGVDALQLTHTTGAATFSAGAVFAGAVSGITTLAGTGAVSGFTTLVLSGTATIGSATDPVLIGRLSGATTYGAISFNGVISSVAATVGLYSRIVDGALYQNVLTGWTHYWMVQGVTTMSLSSTTLTVVPTSVVFTGSALSGITTLTTTGRISNTVTTEQMRLQYDSTHYYSVAVDVSGNAVLDAVGTGGGSTGHYFRINGSNKFAIDGNGTATFTGAVTTTGSYSSTSTTGLSFTNTTAGTGPRYLSLQNTSGTLFLGVEDSVGGNLMSGSTAYAVIVNSATTKPIQFGYNNILHTTLGASGAVTFTGALSGITTLGTTSTITVVQATAANLVLNQTGTRQWTASAASGNFSIVSADSSGSLVLGAGFTLTHAGALSGVTSGAFSGVLSTTSSLAVAATQKVYLDGVTASGDTYIVESAGNQMDVVASGNVFLRANGSGVLLGDSVAAYGTPTSGTIFFRLNGSNAFGFYATSHTPAEPGNFVIANGTAPSGTLVGYGIIWVESGALKFRGTSGTVTTLAPA